MTAGLYVMVASSEITPSAGLTEMGTTASPPGGTNSDEGTHTTLVARAGAAQAHARTKKSSIADVFTIFIGDPFPRLRTPGGRVPSRGGSKDQAVCCYSTSTRTCGSRLPSG